MEGCLEAEKFLDEQNEKLIPEFYELQAICRSLDEGRKYLADFLVSKEGIALFQESSSKDQLTKILLDVAKKKARNDGWTFLNSVGQNASDEITELKESLGHKTLKAMILATEVFDIKEETTDKGGVRVLYRLKPSN